MIPLVPVQTPARTGCADAEPGVHPSDRPRSASPGARRGRAEQVANGAGVHPEAASGTANPDGLTLGPAAGQGGHAGGGLLRVVLHARSADVTLDGELDVATAGELCAVLDWLLRWRLRRLVIDVSSVTFVDLAGLQPLLHAHRQSRAWHGQVQLVGPCPALDLLLTAIVGLPRAAGAARPLLQARRRTAPRTHASTPDVEALVGPHSASPN